MTKDWVFLFCFLRHCYISLNFIGLVGWNVRNQPFLEGEFLSPTWATADVHDEAVHFEHPDNRVVSLSWIANETAVMITASLICAFNYCSTISKNLKYSLLSNIYL